MCQFRRMDQNSRDGPSANCCKNSELFCNLVGASTDKNNLSASEQSEGIFQGKTHFKLDYSRIIFINLVVMNTF